MDTHDEMADLSADEVAFLYGKPPPEYGEEVPEPEEGSTKPNAAPADYGHAAWFAARADEADRRAAEIGAEFDRLIRKLTADKLAAVGPLVKRAAWFDAGIEIWHRTSHANGEHGKTVTFPTGRKSSLRARKPTVVVVSHDEHLAFVEAQGRDWSGVYKQASLSDRWRVSELLKVASIESGSEPGAEGRLVTPDGEAVPGVKVIEQSDSWSNGQKKGKR